MRLSVFLFILLFPCNLYANILFMPIKVESFKSLGNDEYVLTYQECENSGNCETLKKNSPKRILYIRFNKNCVTDLIQSDNISRDFKCYLEAIKELRLQISRSPIIVFGLRSGKGFHAIPDKQNEFQADDLGILKLGDKKRVYSIHSDIGSGYCDK